MDSNVTSGNKNHMIKMCKIKKNNSNSRYEKGDWLQTLLVSGIPTEYKINTVCAS